MDNIPNPSIFSCSHLLINGTEGIRGMSTRIPPHNLREVIDACVSLIDNPALTALDLAKKVKAPDFPLDHSDLR